MYSGATGYAYTWAVRVLEELLVAVEEKVHVCQAGEARRDIWGVACPFFLGSAAGLSPLYKCTGELHGLGSRPYAEKHLLPWLSPTAVSCLSKCPGQESWGRGIGSGGALMEVAAGYRAKQTDQQCEEEMWLGCCGLSGKGQLDGMVLEGTRAALLGRTTMRSVF